MWHSWHYGSLEQTRVPHQVNDLGAVEGGRVDHRRVQVGERLEPLVRRDPGRDRVFQRVAVVQDRLTRLAGEVFHQLLRLVLLRAGGQHAGTGDGQERARILVAEEK